jgi:hypothetical protein
MDERERRVGENEALFRAVNERVEDLNLAFGALTETMNVVCECGYISCAEQIEIDVETYERVRADPTLFVLVPGHAIEGVEDVVERNERFEIVRKRSRDAGRVATETDPRSQD